MTDIYLTISVHKHYFLLSISAVNQNNQALKPQNYRIQNLMKPIFM